MTIMMGNGHCCFPLSFMNLRPRREGGGRLSGRLRTLHSSVQFRSTANTVQERGKSATNYLRNVFSEAWLSRWGVIGCAALLVAMLTLGIFMSPWIRILIYLGGARYRRIGWRAGTAGCFGAHAVRVRGPPIPAAVLYDVPENCWSKQNIVVRRSAELLHRVLPVAGDLHRARCSLAVGFVAGDFCADAGGHFSFVLGAYKASSPYSFIGAERELIQMMAYEPMILLTAIGMYMVTKSLP